MTHHYRQCTIDFTKLTQREQPIGFAQSARIHGAELLDQDLRTLTFDLHLGPKRKPNGHV